MQRLIRKDANTNSILVTEECDQLCVMCSQPPKQKRYDRFDLYFEAVQLAPQGAVIGITGGEPTLLAQQLLAFIQDSCSARPDVAFHILSNGQHFARLPRGSLKGIAAKILWGIPIYAPDPALHDRIVGKIGAYETLMDSFNWLFAERATVELRTVVMAQNLQALPHLADFICTHLRRAHHWAVMQLENYGYGKLNWAQIFADTSLDFCDVARALRRCERAGIETRLYNFPLCTVPVELRARAAKSISDWKQKYLPDCEGCQQRQICCGFFEWYNVDAGFARISPLSGVPA
jgi:His-Xaa-Ser system radical SAM maturase HxsC